MSSVIENCLQDYNWYKLARMHQQWTSLNERERFAVLAGVLVSRDFALAQSLISKHGDELKQKSIYWHFLLHLQSQTQSQFAQAFAGAIEELGSAPRDPYIFGELNFTIGLAMLQNEQCDLALEFFERSNKAFSAEPFDVLIWRGHFNIALCFLKMRKFHDFSMMVLELERKFAKLTVGAQSSISKLMIWLFLHMDKNKQALQLTINSMKQLASEPQPQDQLSYLCKQYFFIRARKLDLTQLESAEENFYLILNSIDRIAVDAFMKARTWTRIDSTVDGNNNDTQFLNREKQNIQKLISTWQTQLNVFDLLQTSEIFLRRLEQLKNDSLLICAYQWIEKNILCLKYVMPPTDLREFGLIAYRRSHNQILFNRLFRSYQINARPWSRKKLMIKIESIDARAGQKVMTLDLEAKELRYGQQTVILSRKLKIMALLKVLFSKKGRVSVKLLATELYPHSKSIGKAQVYNAQALVLRVNKIFAHAFLKIKDGEIFVEDSVRLKLHHAIVQSTQMRHSHLMSYAQSVKSFSIRDLLNHVSVPKRTIQSDLKKLILGGKIKSSGKGRSTTYSSTLR